MLILSFIFLTISWYLLPGNSLDPTTTTSTEDSGFRLAWAHAYAWTVWPMSNKPVLPDKSFYLFYLIPAYLFDEYSYEAMVPARLHRPHLLLSDPTHTHTHATLSGWLGWSLACSMEHWGAYPCLHSKPWWLPWNEVMTPPKGVPTPSLKTTEVKCLGVIAQSLCETSFFFLN